MICHLEACSRWIFVQPSDTYCHDRLQPWPTVIQLPHAASNGYKYQIKGLRRSDVRAYVRFSVRYSYAWTRALGGPAGMAWAIDQLPRRRSRNRHDRFQRVYSAVSREHAAHNHGVEKGVVELLQRSRSLCSVRAQRHACRPTAPTVGRSGGVGGRSCSRIAQFLCTWRPFLVPG